VTSETVAWIRLSIHLELRIQPVDATHWLYRPPGISKANVYGGACRADHGELLSEHSVSARPDDFREVVRASQGIKVSVFGVATGVH